MTTLFINKELNGIEVIFESKPAQAVIDSLKTNGFRWHKVKKLWYAKNTAERLAFAESIVDGKQKQQKKLKRRLPFLLFGSVAKLTISQSIAGQQTQRRLLQKHGNI